METFKNEQVNSTKIHQKQSNIPQIRFKGFNDAWEQRRFGELYKINNERNLIGITVDKTLSVATMKYKKDGNGSAETSVKSYKVLRIGDAGFEGHSNKQFAHGRFVVNTRGIGLMSPRFSSIRPVSMLNPLFTKKLFYLESIFRPILNQSTKLGTMMNELVPEDFFKQVILIPGIEEQNKIGNLFLDIDKFITLHQRKCDQLKNIKKSLLEKLFPKNGTLYPELRFKEFTDAWEQRRLSELSYAIKDGTHGTHLNKPMSGYFLLSAKNLKNGKVMMSHDEREITKEDYALIEKSFKIQKGDVLLSIVGTIGEVVEVQNTLNMVFQRSVAMIRPRKSIISSRFLSYALAISNFKKYLIEHQSVSAQPGIYLGDLLKAHIIFPSLSEQQRIGQFFKDLDTLITLHQRKVEKLKKVKASLLEKMFV